MIHDRYDEKYHRSIEDLKSRYYNVTKKLLEVYFFSLIYSIYQKKNDKINPLCHYIYDPDYEKTRKYHLEKFIMRPKEKNEEERFLMEELKKIEQVSKAFYLNQSVSENKKRRKGAIKPSKNP